VDGDNALPGTGNPPLGTPPRITESYQSVTNNIQAGNAMTTQRISAIRRCRPLRALGLGYKEPSCHVRPVSSSVLSQPQGLP
jgi:hypothetical protein